MSIASGDTLSFDRVARLAEGGDNVAIACQTLPAGSKIQMGEQILELPHTVLEGHRFALGPIAPGEPLLSWGLPFGRAIRPIAPGDYICNQKILTSLAGRHVPFVLPAAPNFEDHLLAWRLDPSGFEPGLQVAAHQEPGTFQGYARPGGRGTGTRNFIVVLGITSLTGSYARAIASAFKGVRSEALDGVVPVAHTEGGETLAPNNLQWTLRTLAGFMTNPNVGAVLAIDHGSEVINGQVLRKYMEEHGYALSSLPHHFLSVKSDFDSAVAEGTRIIQEWIGSVSSAKRTAQPLAGLRLGLQCGGSDAFSGISGNPLVGIMSRELVRHGGSANLAETDELVGAEPYVLANVRDLETAQAFLGTLERFQERVSWHRDSAEGNPSGGNNYRGLYNIAIKSIGAARKKDPAVRLDYVIEYGQPMSAPGFYFMDSPGNDLESIAGQVAAGCNLIVFTTGNGSITNFPFVPTIKIMTTTARFNLLSRDMDLNAGRYLDGTPLEELGREAFAYMVEVASGRKSVGEAGGHSQVQLWREWRQTTPRKIVHRPLPAGRPLVTAAGTDPSTRKPLPAFTGYPSKHGVTTDNVGLVVPTSLCSGQIGRMLAEKLNGISLPGISRFVSLSHTEGCGVSSGECEEIYFRTMAGYLSHPMVRLALLLEHGCEKTHNDAMRNYLAGAGMDLAGLGWASIQMDGGIEKVSAKVVNWFQSQPAALESRTRQESRSPITLGLTSIEPVPQGVAAAFGGLIERWIAAGGTIIIPRNASLWGTGAVLNLKEAPEPTLAYGQTATEAGLHVMESPSEHTIETLTGMGAAGTELFIAFTAKFPLQSHPLIPLLQVATSKEDTDWQRDMDLLVEPSLSPATLLDRLLSLVALTTSRHGLPKLFAKGHQDFQITRGRYGISL